MTTLVVLPSFSLVCLAALTFSSQLQLNADSSVEHFEKSIRPALVQQCYECHSAATEKLKGGLRLDSRESLLAGGDSGPAVVPGQPEASLLISALKQQRFEMPPSGKLPEQLIKQFEDWIARGAPTPTSFESTSVPATTPSFSKPHWAFQPIIRPSVPIRISQRAVQNPIDQFILARLEQKGLTLSSQASRNTLIRRLAFDTTGIPPDSEHLAEPDYVRNVDQLLASPHFGEHWGRKWLDLARYADTNGVDENYNYLHAWRYRDYVIQAFNQNKPFNQFLMEQLAGDLLAAESTDERKAEQLIATGFLTLGPKMLAEQDKDKLLIDIVDEQVDVVSRTTMGLTMGCARCHDHKFDPIRTEDYYALAGIFASTQTMSNTNHVSFWTETTLPDANNNRIQAAFDQEVLTRQIELTQLKEEPETDERKRQIKAKEKALTEFSKVGPQFPKAMAVVDGEVKNIPVHIRGSHVNLASKPVPRGFPEIVAKQMQPYSIDNQTSGRYELSQWLTAQDNPLTARVIVNRIWQGYFGIGLVSTPSNFGLRGALPTHPKLLDWLASELIENEWSLKHIHRLILLSATYRQSSAPRPEAKSNDPNNRLYWRQNQRRLTAESIRDTILHVGNRLDTRLGGVVKKADRNETYYRGDGGEFDSTRRAIYLPVIRGRGYEMFNTFDYSDSGAHLAQRTTTTVPHQALFMLNSSIVKDSSEALAAHLTKEGSPPTEQIHQLYQRLFSRPPSRDERKMALAHFERLQPLIESETHRSALGVLAQSLIAANEFIYID